MIQHIKIPGCGRGPLALADGSNILGHCLGRNAYMPLPYHTLPYHMGLSAIEPMPWPGVWEHCLGFGAMAKPLTQTWPGSWGHGPGPSHGPRY